MPSALRGRVIGVPVANPIALEHFTRMTPDESDEPDLNRVWPGGKTWITEQIAAALDREVLAGTNYLMDFHPGPWGAALATIGYGADLPDEKVRRESLEMAIAFGHPSVRALKMMAAFPGPRSIAGTRDRSGRSRTSDPASVDSGSVRRRSASGSINRCAAFRTFCGISACSTASRRGCRAGTSTSGRVVNGSCRARADTFAPAMGPTR